MKNYSFLIKPLFFIFNLLFATWLVLQIEKIKPSDFGKHAGFFGPTKKEEPSLPNRELRKKYLYQLCGEFKAGRLDSARLNEELNRYIDSQEKLMGKR